MIATSGFEILPIIDIHVLELEKLPLLHTYPFDRMLIAQTKAEKFTLITIDVKMTKDDIEVL